MPRPTAFARPLGCEHTGCIVACNKSPPARAFGQYEGQFIVFRGGTVTDRSLKREITVGLVVAVIGGLLVAILVAVFRIGAPSAAEGPEAPPSSDAPAVQPSASSLPGPTTQGTLPTAEEPTQAYLAELAPIERDEGVAEAIAMGGVNYVRAVALSSGGCGGNQDTGYSWVVNGAFSTLSTTVGLDDRTPTGPEVNMEILLDGSPAFSQTIQAGNFIPVLLDTTGVREIRLHQTYIGPRPNICSTDAVAVWADPLLTK